MNHTMPLTPAPVLASAAPIAPATFDFTETAPSFGKKHGPAMSRERRSHEGIGGLSFFCMADKGMFLRKEAAKMRKPERRSGQERRITEDRRSKHDLFYRGIKHRKILDRRCGIDRRQVF